MTAIDLATNGRSIALQVFGEDRIAVLKEQLGRGWKEPMTDAELEHIGVVCSRTRLDPLAKPAQIYFIKRWDSRLRKEVMTPQVSIDGLRLIAQRSREYGGATPYLYCGEDGIWKEFWTADEPPVAAKAGVKRRGWTDWLYATATWKEWAQWQEFEGKRKLAPFWASKPAHMLGKTAEAIALKRAFPEETNELELARIDEDWRVQQAINVEKYNQIFGSDQDHTPFDLPDAYRSATPALNAAGDQVDTVTGEIVEEHASEHESQEPSEPTLQELWAENRRLVEEARQRNVHGATLGNRSGPGALQRANADLAERIRNHDLDQQAARESEQQEEF